MPTSPSPTPPLLNLATWAPITTAEGPGRRFALWVQGCAIRCEHCCNPEMFAFVPRHEMSQADALTLIREAHRDHAIEGITCLGGEPFAQANALAPLAEAVQAEGLSVMVFTGYLREDLEGRDDPAVSRLLAATDILVDGPYQASLHTNQRRWIGSTNQRVHFLSDRYDPDDPVWEQPNSIDIHFDGSTITVTGFPEGPWSETMKHWNRWARKTKRKA